MKYYLPAIVILLLMLNPVPTITQDSSNVLNIYSSRHYGAMEAPFIAFEEATGIEVRVSAGSPRDLLGRLRADIQRGKRSVADVFLAIDAGVLSIAAEEGLLATIESDVLNTNIPENLRDPEGYWYALSRRARTAIYNPTHVTEEEINEHLNTYADLADPIWQDRLCMRPASHIYTVSLFSSIVYHLGEETTTEVISGIADNVVRYINSDTSQIRAVAAGECDIALVNHYYMGRITDSEDDDAEISDIVHIRWLNQGQDNPGVFYNINGAGVIVNAANFDNAVAFIEFMSSLDGQSGDVDLGFPGSNYEYPVNPDAELNATIADFGEFKFDSQYALWDYGHYQARTVELLEEVGFGFDEN